MHKLTVHITYLRGAGGIIAQETQNTRETFNLSLHKNGKEKKISKWLCHGNLQELYTFKVPRKAPQPKSHVSSVVVAESKHDRGKCTQEDLYPIKQECKGGKPDP